MACELHTLPPRKLAILSGDRGKVGREAKGVVPRISSRAGRDAGSLCSSEGVRGRLKGVVASATGRAQTVDDEAGDDADVLGAAVREVILVLRVVEGVSSMRINMSE